MPKIEIKRGYEVLPDNNVRFGIRIINNSDFIISDVEVILDHNESLFKLEGSKIQNLGTIPPAVPRTAKFLLQPLGCIHKEEIGATVRYKDHQWKKHTEEMRPKEVHCVCPFLKEKSITRQEFLRLSNSGYLKERGVNFEGIDVDKLLDFISHTCKNRLYKVDELPIENGRILYLAGDALGEKAHYLLTVVVKEYEGLVQVLLRASSDKNHGLIGFLNEILDNLRHLVVSASAREIGVIRKEQVINIIDSVVQRSSFSVSDGAPSVNVRDSVVQRAEIKADEERKKHEGERLRKEREIQEQRAEEERLRRQSEEAARIQQEKESERTGIEHEEKSSGGGKWFFGLIIILAVLALGWYGTQDSNNPAISPPQKNITNSIGMEFMLIPAGEFDMGSPSNEKDRSSDEGPVHRVKISNAFYMGKYEVTQKHWRDVMGTSPSYFKGDNLPVEQVSWNDVQDFIMKLNDKEGGNKYRLPTEAEWEYAARAGTTTRYSFGDDESKLGDYAWYYANSGSKTHDVGQKNPNPWGLYDMHGNVWEWLSDQAHIDYNGAPIDGSSWGRDGSVIRGGDWSDSARNCRSATRSSAGTRDGYLFGGFRLRMDALASTNAPETLKSTSLATPKVNQTISIPVITPASDKPSFTNSIGVEFVLIPAGEFDMGSPSNEKDRSRDEGPVYRVKISNAFYMGKYEVTQKQWRDVMGTSPSYFKGDDLPIENVSWYDVQDFIKKLNQKEGMEKYRLPTEAEWEYSARAGTTTRYSFGDDETILGDYAWYDANSGSKTHGVGQKKPNPWGLYDMHGNAWEWVQDIYHDSYSGAPIDGSSWEGDGSSRINRGGGWGDGARIYRSAFRSDYDPGGRVSSIGFRLLRVS